MKTDWNRFNTYFFRDETTGVWLDVSRVHFDEDLFVSMSERISRAFKIMRLVEEGGLANPDEQRMVGHYWLRSPELAPFPELRDAIHTTNRALQRFGDAVRAGEIKTPAGVAFTRVLVVGIGGSALGPQFVADALGPVDGSWPIDFLDNTDPDGMQRVFERIGDEIRTTLVVVISKSGGTKETRNGMLESEARFREANLSFPGHAAAITGEGSELDQLAVQHKWLERFPMWDWVGGRTSLMSAVGILPMALLGIDFGALLKGASDMDALTRVENPRTNPAMLLALMWFRVGHGHGQKDMVVLPYSDRLVLFSKYLQQLVMESLGKECDLEGRKVNQGLAVYGNKGSTDQHAYVQQLRDGLNNFFATLIEVRKVGSVQREVEAGITIGDYLQGFLRGTRDALSQNDRETITLSLPEVSPYHIGALIALYERAVGLYAGLIHVNAYHQPGVEAGKKAATAILTLQRRVVSALSEAPGATAEAIAAAVSADPETVYHILNHLVASGQARVTAGASAREDLFSK